MLHHHSTDLDVLSSDTRTLRFTDPLVGCYFPTTQVWTWDAEEGLPSGEAAIVVTNSVWMRPRSHAVVRFGDDAPKVYEVPGGLHGLFELLGLPQPKLA